MDNDLNANWTVMQVIETYPQTIPVFLDLKTDCVGCYLERFCSLKVVAVSYHLPVEVLVEKLRVVISLRI